MNDHLTAVVTGAAGGIGFALASLLGARGYQLILADIDAQGLDARAGELSAHLAIPTDVADPSAMQHLAEEAGPVDLLCLNAGVTSTFDGAPWESPPEEWERVFGVNLGGVVNGLRCFVPLMFDRAVPSSILITASLAGVATWPGGGPYAASKHAVLSVAEQAALQLSNSDISVTVLCPALVRTAMSDEGEDPRQVAADGLQAVADGRFAVVPPEWSTAVRGRASTLVAGGQPAQPSATGDPSEDHVRSGARRDRPTGR